QRASIFEMFGVPHDDAVAIASAGDDTMSECILALYRSAVNVGKEWSSDFRDIPAPGLVIVPSDDAFLNGDGARAAAKGAGAKVAELTGIGHWWMLQNPALGASTLESFWSSL